MDEPTQKDGTIISMACPQCGTLGVRYLTGDDALDRWKTDVAELSVLDIRSGGSSPVTDTDGDLLPAFVPPDDAPPDTDVLHCREMDGCGWVKYTRIQWAKVPKRAVR